MNVFDLPIYNSTGRINIHAIATRSVPRKDAVDNWNSAVHLTIAMDAVVFTPATTKVAPVSPKDRAKARTAPENILGIESGKVMFLKVVNEFAPKVLEANSYVESID